VPTLGNDDRPDGNRKTVRMNLSISDRH